VYLYKTLNILDKCWTLDIVVKLSVTDNNTLLVLSVLVNLMLYLTVCL